MERKEKDYGKKEYVQGIYLKTTKLIEMVYCGILIFKPHMFRVWLLRQCLHGWSLNYWFTNYSAVNDYSTNL